MPEHRVLIVEDERSWQENFQEAIQGLGYAVQIASTFVEADSVLGRRHFHLVLIDLRLGERTQELEGMKLLEKIAGMSEGSSTIIISGYADATIATEALKRYDAFYVLEKDRIDSTRFIELVKEGVSQAEERYRRLFSSALDFLSGEQDVHTWASEILRAILGTERRLELRDLDRLRGLLNQLLVGLYPLLPSRLGETVRTQAEAGTVQARYWSKGLGEPILIAFGSNSGIARQVEDVDRLDALALQRQVIEDGELAGAVFVLNDAAFEEFSGAA
jgi:ActR/RegA family two-component response regulator